MRGWDLTVIGGRLVDERGAPVREALVGAVGRHDRVVARTNSQGRFALGINAAEPVRVVARKSGHAFGVRRGVAPGTLDLELVLPRSGGLTGRVAARPMPRRFRVTLWRFEAGECVRAKGCSVLRLPGGLFSVSRLTPGVYEVRAEAEGCAPASVSVDVEAGEVVSGIELRLRRSGSRDSE